MSKAVKTAAKKATKTAAKASSRTAQAAAPTNGDLAIHINKTGRVCFGRAAAERIGELAWMTVAAAGKGLRMVAKAKETEGALPIRRANGRPYVSATRALKDFGFDGTKAYDVEASAHNATGFEFRL